MRVQTYVCLYTHDETPAPEGVRDERPGSASGAAAEHTEPKANVRLPGARNEREMRNEPGNYVARAASREGPVPKFRSTSERSLTTREEPPDSIVTP